MADSALFVGWNRSIAGREQQAMGLFARVMEYYGQLQNEGKIESFEPAVLSAHGGDLNGFIILRCDADKLSEVRQDETFISITMEADYCLEYFGIILGFIGEGLTDVFARYSELIGG